MGKDILLDAGTNEMELLVFRLGPTPFGVNVAKVREIIQRVNTIEIPHAPASVEGSFSLREEVLTLVNLGRYFEMEGEETRQGAGMIIVVEFNKVRCGVLVDSVEMIHRLRWDEIEPPSGYLTSMGVPITGSTQVDGKTVLVADFETVIADILGIRVQEVSESSERSPVERAHIRVLFADDSETLRTGILRVLSKGGYQTVTLATDGQDAWDKLQARREEPNGPFDLVLSDIEMPRMDGLHLTKRIKEDPQFRSIPVVLFSSLISVDNLKKGRMVGADEQVSKPESNEMLMAMERCLLKSGVLKLDV
jgi:two-component system chemotaxis response regulator CheV